MALPAEFNQKEHLQDVIRRWINREVREYFSDLGGDEFDPDIRDGRHSLRVACTHMEGDSLLETQLRWQLFERIRRSAFDMPFYGIPVPGYHQARKFKPQIMLYFQEDIQDVEPGYAPVTGEVSFRLMDYESDTLNPAIAATYAQRINSNFAIGGGFVWRKGREMCTYTDQSRGYKLQILCRDDQYARDLVDRVLDVQNHTPDWSKFNHITNANPAERFPTIPPTDRIYGEQRRRPRQRPVADCRFQFATLNIHGLVNPQPLVDRTGLYPSAIVAA